ncbi:hypothetical protein DES40_0852 [Litorimonas taeanensis]|uniref:Secreted protein (TIGR04161 family) n=1 Tax=Litorimonas taeanensis TaxID=568099 RepID=A0A420WKN3_9PROT|nr:hypothetical protein [Litorimonas taeanensis]RKQ71529.1 hypothetical protein DES40_0852 [Litorimonas taeanensis]
MKQKLKTITVSSALAAIATPALADGGHVHMTTMESIVHFLSSPTHGLITLAIIATAGFVAVKMLRKKS